MKKNIKLITWIAAIAVGLSITASSNAHERGDRGHYNGGARVIVNAPDYVYYEPAYRNNRVVYQNRGNGHAYGKPYFTRAEYKKIKKRQKVKKMRRMHRAQRDRYYDRPVIIVTRDRIRF